MDTNQETGQDKVGEALKAQRFHMLEDIAKELKGNTLKLNAHIPRIARRFEAALDSLSIGFHKTRPTRLFLQKMASDPSSVLPVGSEDQFERLFKTINAALERHLAR